MATPRLGGESLCNCEWKPLTLTRQAPESRHLLSMYQSTNPLIINVRWDCIVLESIAQMSGFVWVLGNMWDADLCRRVFSWRSHAYWQHSRTNWAYLQLLFEKQSSRFNKTCVQSSLWSMKIVWFIRSVQMDSIQIIQFTKSGVRYGTVLPAVKYSSNFQWHTSVLKQKLKQLLQ